MRPNILRITPLLVVAFLGVLLLTPLLGHGEDAPAALDEYARYLPGNPIPTNLSCDTNHNFYEEFHTRCRVEGGAHCAFGQIMADRGVIVQTTFYMCQFPVAYLTAEYGHFQSTQRLNRWLVLRWYSVNAQVSGIGRPDTMEIVQTVTWWRPDESSTEGL
jgi:hypothetical protein